MKNVRFNKLDLFPVLSLSFLTTKKRYEMFFRFVDKIYFTFPHPESRKNPELSTKQRKLYSLTARNRAMYLIGDQSGGFHL